MIIAGFDPGSRFCGYCFIEVRERENPRILEMGTWEPWRIGKKNTAAKFKTAPLGERLEFLFEQASLKFKKFNPRWIGLEKAIVFKNVSSSLVLSEARAAVRIAAHVSLDEASKRWIELSPTEIKKIAGTKGTSSKSDIRRVLGFRFANSEIFENFTDSNSDAFDALAIAYTTWVRFKERKLEPCHQP